MRLRLTGLKRFEQDHGKIPRIDGLKRMRVAACGICRTDAKMWSQGHRELVFPRVPGHEIVVEDDKGKRYAVWPGRVCGQCRYCLNQRENLCDEMKITGFHFDGGFSDHINVPESCLLPVPPQLPHYMACFAEPVGCVFNSLEKIELSGGERAIVYGGGTLGLISALVCKRMGIVPLVIEKSQVKIEKIKPFLEMSGIECRKDTRDGEFHLAINACPDVAAFNLGIIKLARGGRYSFFSGLNKNGSIDTNLINLLHYKELELRGSYGLTRAHMKQAIDFILAEAVYFEALVEETVSPGQVPGLMENVLSGRFLKYMIDFHSHSNGMAHHDTDGDGPGQADGCGFRESGKAGGPGPGIHESMKSPGLKSVLERIHPPEDRLKPAAQHKIDNKTKPLGALGRLEELALQMCLIQNSLNPEIHRKAMFVFAADHGIAEEGVSAFPAEVTGQMVENFLNQGAAINVLCQYHGIDIRVVDMGVNAEFGGNPLLYDKKIRKGTRNFAVQEAMTRDEAVKAIENGMDVFRAEYGKKEIQILGVGEMGIGNTTSASSIISCVTGISPFQATGRGTGIDDKGLEHKAEIIEKALAFHRPDPEDGMEILRKVGGFEIAGMVGAICAAAAEQVAVVLDGLISTAAGLLAFKICPEIKGYLISGHRSVEKAQNAALELMGLEPLVDLNMRLGEGTGAALAIDTVAAACKIMTDMASFDEAGVSSGEETG